MIYLYRVIDERELSDVLRFGDYGHSENFSGKYFALTEDGARHFLDLPLNRGRNSTLTRIRVPQLILCRGYRFPDPGGAGRSIHFDDEVLPELYLVAGKPEIVQAAWIRSLGR